MNFHSVIAHSATAIRHPVSACHWLRPYDYQPSGLLALPATLDDYFPTVRHGRTRNLLVPHRARADRRYPKVGWVTWDEASLLFNYGKLLAGRPMLEIGCWVGWSTVVLASSGVSLTVIDPVLDGAAQGETCRDAVQRATLSSRVTFVPGASPQALKTLTAQGARWSGFFIDGDHAGEAPLNDVKECAAAAEPDAVILLHDMVQSNVADALSWLHRNGWHIGVHYTLQFIGVAWRGQLKPVLHTADPNVRWNEVVAMYPHLMGLPRL